jgi:hypothetical protein
MMAGFIMFTDPVYISTSSIYVIKSKNESYGNNYVTIYSGNSLTFTTTPLIGINYYYCYIQQSTNQYINTVLNQEFGNGGISVLSQSNTLKITSTEPNSQKLTSTQPNITKLTSLNVSIILRLSSKVNIYGLNSGLEYGKYKFYSSNSDVADIDLAGNIKCKKVGKFYIIVTDMSGTIIYTTPYFIDVIGSLILQV